MHHPHVRVYAMKGHGDWITRSSFFFFKQWSSPNKTTSPNHPSPDNSAIVTFWRWLHPDKLTAGPTLEKGNHLNHPPPFLGPKCSCSINGWDAGSPKRWDRWHSPSPNWQEKYHLYTTYSPCRTWGGYIYVICYLPPTCYGNQKQPLIPGCKWPKN